MAFFSKLRSAPALIITIVTIAVVALGGGSFLKSRYDENVAQHLLRQSETQRVAWRAVTQMHQIGMEVYFQSMIMQPDVIALLLKAQNADEATQNSVRQALLKRLDGAYATLKKRGVGQLQFHTPQTHSFLRFHSPDRYGDSLVAERPLVVKANTERTPTHGFETGRVISGFRNVFPIITPQGNHLGTVEFSQPFEYIRREMARINPNREYLMILSSRMVLPKIFDENRQYYATSCFGPDWLVEDPKREWADAPPAISPEAMALGKLAIEQQGALEKLEAGQAVAFDVYKAGRHHYTTLTPIYDIDGALNAYLVSFSLAPELDTLSAHYRQQGILLVLFLLAFGVVFYWFLVSRQALKALNGELSDRVKREVGLRISEVKRLSREKELQQALLIQQSKQAEIGSMIGAIAHQWKQPLNSISVMTQTLIDLFEEGDLNKKKLLEHIRQVMKQIAFMTETINDFRSFYKPSKGKERFSLNRAVGSVVDLLKVQLDRHNTQITVTGDDFIQAQGYPSEFKQVVLNLINNAKEAARDRQTPCLITIRIEAKGDKALIRIADNGGGIAPELLPDKLFEPFSSTKGDEGTGIGLSLSRTIIEEKMNGRLTVRNINGGAEFTIELPAA